METSRERRQFGRRTTKTMASIIVPGRPRLNCRIVNISSKGAMLEFEPPDWLPFNFKIFIEGSAEFIDCQIRHVVQHGVGVNFSQCQSVHQTAVGTPSIEQQRQWIGENKRQMRVESACRRFGAQKL